MAAPIRRVAIASVRIVVSRSAMRARAATFCERTRPESWCGESVRSTYRDSSRCRTSVRSNSSRSLRRFVVCVTFTKATLRCCPAANTSLGPLSTTNSWRNARHASRARCKNCTWISRRRIRAQHHRGVKVIAHENGCHGSLRAGDGLEMLAGKLNDRSLARRRIALHPAGESTEYAFFESFNSHIGDVMLNPNRFRPIFGVRIRCSRNMAFRRCIHNSSVAGGRPQSSSDSTREQHRAEIIDRNQCCSWGCSCVNCAAYEAGRFSKIAPTESGDMRANTRAT